MATIDNKAIIDRIIAANGVEYVDEPPVVKIVEYVNAWGVTTWGVVWDGEDTERYNRPTQYVRSPRTIWEKS